MYNFEMIKQGLTNPRMAAIELNSLYFRDFNKSNHNKNGSDIFNEDWDVLIILDACRYDMFRNNNTISGNLEYRISQGSNTPEYLEANIGGKCLHDTVYTTANPQLHRNWSRINPDLHAIIDVWKESGWDKETGTVLPETMTEFAIESVEQYPNKRHIIHYIQPHYPFISNTTRSAESHLANPAASGDNIWKRIMSGRVDPEEYKIEYYYNQNLREVLPYIEQLIDDISGKIVITSDHGNMLGERGFPIPVKIWGHPRGIYADELVKIPWLTIKNGSRPEIKAEPPDSVCSGVDNSTIGERLKQLGYK
ncbi:hypothetical protein [Halosegnis longus]|uniref:hypothetical protein n=1 Tax=Halosegnis longus TaxID=2216012 RepID=UPI00129E39DE|nr:hypothetical protein [Halosegnis longus]